MATDLKAKSQPARHELFVEQQIERVSKRIHAIEVGKTLLTWLVVTLAYALVMSLFDLITGKEAGPWAAGVRIGGLALYLVATLWLGVIALSRYFRRINPYYAARQIEETIPDAKNSVVNWLDLRQSKLPPIIRNALGLRAARDLKGTDPEKAVDARATWMLAGALGILVIGIAALFLSGPNQFGSLMRRAFLPMGDFALAGRTEITLLQPEDGHVAVTLQEKVEFRARISGAVPRINTPHAPRLWHRYNPTDQWASTPLQEDNNGDWTASMAPDQVQGGFWYKLTAGDAETNEYQVTVRGTPQAERFQVIYHPRSYLRVPQYKIDFPNQQDLFPRIKALTGTEVTLAVKANRPLAQGRVEVELGGVKQDDLIGVLDPEDSHVFHVKFRPEKSGRFRVIFVTKNGEPNTDRSTYPIDVWTDGVPNVVLLKPGEDVSLPANGTLQLEGLATDDFGIKEMSLQMTLHEGAVEKPLEAKVYRPEKKLQFADGSYPDRLEYKDFVALDSLKTAGGKAIPLAAGMVLEYYLQARDNSDYPEKLGNLGRSKTFKVNILAPQDAKKAEQDRSRAEQEQKKNEQKQDQDLKKQEEDRTDRTPSGDPKTPEQKKVDDVAKKLKDEIEKKEQKERGEAKGDNDGQPKSEKKDGGGDQPNTSKDESKPAPADNQTGTQKDGGQKDNAPMKDQQAGNSKDAGEKKDTSEAKKEPGAKQEHGNAKDQGKAESKESAGASKDQGQNEKPGAEQKPSTAKQNAPDKGEKPSQAKEQKPGNEGTSPQAKDDRQGAKEQPKQAKDGDNDDKSGARGANSEPEKAASKPGPGDDPKQETAGAKSHDAKSAPSQDAKQTDPNQAKKAGESKEASSPEQTAGDASEDTKRQNEKLKQAADSGDPQKVKQTLKDIARDARDPDVRQKAKEKLEEMQQKANNPEASQKAEKTLKDLERNAKDQETRDAARKGLEEMQKKDKGSEARKTGEEALKDVQQQTKDPEAAKQAENALDKMKKESKDQDAKKTAEDALKELERQAKDPETRKKVAEALKEMDRLAKDPEARKAAEDALKELQKKTQDPETSKKAEETLKEMEKLAQNPETKKAIEDALKDIDQMAQKQPSPRTGRPGNGPEDDLRPNFANPEFKQRGGDLNLEDLRKKVTPEILKKAGLNEQEWQQFLKDAKAYQDAMGKQRPTDPLTQRGDPSQWQNVGPRRIESNNQTTSPTESGRALPPPEFREKYFRWTTRPDSK